MSLLKNKFSPLQNLQNCVTYLVGGKIVLIFKVETKKINANFTSFS